jgi:hypothetical protein
VFIPVNGGATVVGGMLPRLIDTALLARARKPLLAGFVGLPLALVSHSRQAEAQSCPEHPSALDTRPRDQAMFSRGVELLDEGRQEEACVCFYESQRLAYDPKKLLILAECDERHGHLVAALEKYRELLHQLPSQPHTKIRDSRERSARQGIERLERRVAGLVLAPSPTPRSVVQLNGQPTSPGATPALDPGIYRLEVSAPGHETHRESLRLVEGQRLEYALPALSPVKSSRFGLAPPVLVGAGAVLAGFGTYYGLSALASGRRYEQCVDSATCDRLEQDWKSKADTATWLWVGAGLVAGTGITLYVLAPGADSSTQQQPGANLSAWAGAGAAGVSATGSF